MDNQPKPAEAISCMNCKFSRLVRPHPQALDRIRMCHFLPPTPMMAMTQNGPTLLPSTHSPVMNQDWCAQFQTRAAGEPENVEDAPRIALADVTPAPSKLLM